MHSDGEPTETEEKKSERRLEAALLAETQKPYRQNRKPKPEWYGKHPLDWVIVFFTIIAAGAAIAAAVYTGREVSAANKQVVAALQSVSYSKQEVGVMQDQEERQLRAYVTVSELTQTVSGQGPNVVYVVIPVIRNSGLTPATHVAITNVTPSNEWLRHNGNGWSPNYSYIDWKVGAPEDPDDVVDDTGIMKIPPVVIGAGSSLTASSLADDLSASASLDAQSNKIGRFFYGSIHYDDVFGVPHITKYCFRIDGAQINAGSIIPLQSVCSHWNCIDDDCKIDRTSYDQDAKKAQKSPP